MLALLDEGRYAVVPIITLFCDATRRLRPLLETGQTFADRYRIRRRLAEGGMGAIFEADHLGTERRVALKLLFPHIMSVGSAREKFELEAKVAARVNSPHIVQVLDAGFDEPSKSPYLVMELLSGDTLGAIIKGRGPLAPREAVALLRQVASGLDAAHGYKDSSGVAMPIVHRDLKPENLFVTVERDGSPLVKILDFGIAKVLSDTGNVSQEVRGTPLYMAFEQVTAGRLSPATDIWALGLIAYYTLTGGHYWRSARAEGAGVQSIFAEIVTLPLEPPSVRMREQGVDTVLGEAFDAWLLDCIDREPKRRFASAGAAIEALAGAFAESAPVARRTSTPNLSLEPSRTATLQGPAGNAPGAATAPSLPAIASERTFGMTGRGAGSPWRVVAAAGLGLAAIGIAVGVYWAVGSESGGASSRGAAAVAPGAAARPLPAVAPAAKPQQADPRVGSPELHSLQPSPRVSVVAPVPTPAAAPDAGAARDYPVPTGRPRPFRGRTRPNPARRTPGVRRKPRFQAPLRRSSRPRQRTGPPRSRLPSQASSIPYDMR